MKKLFSFLLIICSIILVIACKQEPEPEPVVLSYIEITNQAFKTEYFVGEELDTTGLEITAYYSDGSSEIVEDWTVEGFDSSAASSSKRITVVFEGKRTSYYVKIIAIKILRIEITNPATKTEYCIKEKLDTSGLEVSAIMNDGTKKVITGYTTYFSSSVISDDVKVSIYYSGYSINYSVKVKKHDFDEKWSYDEENHWHAALCGHDVIDKYGKHNMSSDCKCIDCGYFNNEMTVAEFDDRISGVTKITANNSKTGIYISDDGLTANIYNIKLTQNSGYVGFPSSLVSADLSGIDFSNVSDTSYMFNGCKLESVTLPSSVTSIGRKAFYNCTRLTSVTIPSGVTSIGEDAFYNCTGLTSVTIPSGVTSIGDRTFKKCTELTSITIPSGVTSIGDSAFHDCYRLTSITIPSSVTSIGSDAFQNCNSITVVETDNAGKWAGINFENGQSNPLCGSAPFLRSIKLYENGIEVKNLVIDSSVNKVSSYAFYNCKGLTSVTIPSGVTSIGDCAFRDCTGLTRITIPSSVTSIGASAFSNCTGLTSVIIPSSVTSIGRNAFCDCTGLTSITIPSSVTSIEDYAFYNCTGLTSVTIPSSVTSIGREAFYNCRSITVVETDNAGKWAGINFEDGDSNPLYNSHSIKLYENGKEVKNLVIDSSVNKVSSYAFYNCTGLTSVTIPSSVTSIGRNAFYNCKGLTSVTIPSSVTSIGGSAFYYCTGLTRVTIPSSVTSIGSKAFYKCSSITVVETDNAGKWAGINFEDGDSNPLYNSHSIKLYENGKEVKNLVIDSSVNKVSSYAFYNCTGLTSVTIPSSVTSIGEDAFSNCTELTSVTIPSGVTTIGRNAFGECIRLTKVKTDNAGKWAGINFESPTSNPLYYAGRLYVRSELAEESIVIHSSVNKVSSYAFYNCKGLTSVTIPSGVTSIGDCAFRDCTGLTRITIPSSVTSIGASAFSNCTGLTSVIIPSSVTSIGAGVFSNCTGLTSVTIPSSVTSIEASAFNYCKGLTSITIPSSVTSIEDYAFLNVPKVIYSGSATGSPWGAKEVVNQ
ncbi:MAG: leucine-rich repeat protein [Treponema sp.]|nr:leucine-rich repeat protein [Treponema sp.]